MTIHNKEHGFPMVSVVMPVYNAAPFLEECLDSVIRQTFRNIEIICIDDGSTDESLRILNNYSIRDNRLIVCKNPRNIGGSPTRNIGLNIAKGKYIMFLDSDDIYDLNFIEYMYRSISVHDADMVMCAFEIYKGHIHKNPQKKDTDFADIHKNGYNAKTLPNKILQIGNSGPTTKMYNKEFLLDNDISFQNLKNSNDVFFVNICKASAKKIIYVPYVFVYYRQHGKQASNSRVKYYNEIYKALKKTYIKLVSTGLFDVIYKSYINRAIDSIIYQYHFLNDDDKDEFISFWGDEGFLNIGLYNVLDSDFYKDEFRNFYSMVMSISKRNLDSKVQNSYDEDNIRKNMLVFPFHLFPINSKVLLYGRKDICRILFSQAKCRGEIHIVGMSFAGENQYDQLKSSSFQYILICELKMQKAQVLKKKLMDIGIKENCIKWTDVYSPVDFTSKVYLPVLHQFGKMVHE